MVSLSSPSHDSCFEEPTVVLLTAEFVDDDPLCINVIREGINMQFLVQPDETVTNTAERTEIERIIRAVIEQLLRHHSADETIVHLLHHTHVKSASLLLASMPQKKNMEDDAEDTDDEKTH